MTRPLIGITTFQQLLEDRTDTHVCGVRSPQAVSAVAGEPKGL